MRHHRNKYLGCTKLLRKDYDSAKFFLLNVLLTLHICDPELFHVNNKDADQPVHPRTLIIRYQESIEVKHVLFQIPMF